MEINKEQKYKWARRMIPIWWHQLKVAKKEGRIVEFEGFPPVLRKYEKSLKLFLELLSKEYDTLDDFYRVVQGEDEEFLIELAEFCQQEIIPPRPKRPKKVE